MAPSTRELLSKLAALSWIRDFYLAGGTALALQLGHRISVDLDFFTSRLFQETTLIERLTEIGRVEILQKEAQSVTGLIDDVKFSFLGYQYPQLKQGPECYGVRLASIEDIACMKLDAISHRGLRRDFIDLFFIMKQIQLPEILKLFEAKYSSIRYNMLHVKKSLVYFIDADCQRRNESGGFLAV